MKSQSNIFENLPSHYQQMYQQHKQLQQKNEYYYYDGNKNTKQNPNYINSKFQNPNEVYSKIAQPSTKEHQNSLLAQYAQLQLNKMQQHVNSINPLEKQDEYRNLKNKISKTQDLIDKKTTNAVILAQKQKQEEFQYQHPKFQSQGTYDKKVNDFDSNPILPVLYDKQMGLNIFIDFVTSMPINFSEIAFTYSFINKFDNLDDINVRHNTNVYYTEKESPFTTKCIIRDKSPLFNIPPSEETIIFITMHAWELKEEKTDQNTCFRCWTIYELFNKNERIFAGRAKLPFFSQRYSHHNFYTQDSIVALPESFLHIRVAPTTELSLQKSNVQHESLYKIPTFLQNKVELTSYKPNINNIGRLHDGLGKPNLKEIQWDTSVAQLLHSKQATENLKKNIDNQIDKEKKRQLEEKLNKIYENTDEVQEDFTSEIPELDFSLNCLNNYMEKNYVTYEIQLLFFENQIYEDVEVLMELTSKKIFEPYIRKRQIRFEESFDLKINLQKLLEKALTLKYQQNFVLLFKFFQSVDYEVENGMIEDYAWFIHPLFDQQKKYNFGKFNKIIYYNPIPKFHPFDSSSVEPTDVSVSFHLYPYVKVVYNDPFFHNELQNQGIERRIKHEVQVKNKQKQQDSTNQSFFKEYSVNSDSTCYSEDNFHFYYNQPINKEKKQRIKSQKKTNMYFGEGRSQQSRKTYLQNSKKRDFNENIENTALNQSNINDLGQSRQSQKSGNTRKTNRTNTRKINDSGDQYKEPTTNKTELNKSKKSLSKSRLSKKSNKYLSKNQLTPSVSSENDYDDNIKMADKY